MEENISDASQINSVHVEKVLQTSIAYMDRKRKLQAEELGGPPTKHKWLSRNVASEHVYSSDADSDAEGVNRCESGQESAKDSNSIAADADSTISVSNEVDYGADQRYPTEYLRYQPFTASIDWGGNCSKHAINAFGSRSMIRSSSAALESPAAATVTEHDFPNQNVDLHSSINFEEQLLEFGGHVDCSCSECKTNFEDCTEKELEEILLSNCVSPNNYVLSSGRWTLNQDAQQGTDKLTIDKEFEQYFSTLML